MHINSFKLFTPFHLVHSLLMLLDTIIAIISCSMIVSGFHYDNVARMAKYRMWRCGNHSVLTSIRAVLEKRDWYRNV